MNPASSNMPSDWYPEKSPAALTNDRKQTKQMASAMRGQTFSTINNAASIPTQHNAVNMCEPLEIHKSVGANQNLAGPSCAATALKYSAAGRIPLGPISPRI